MPADIKYIDFHGTKEQKFARLEKISFNDEDWRSTRTLWDAPFTPAALSDWDSYPALSDIYPWFTTGVTPNRNWVSGPSRDVLHARMNELILEDDPEKKKLMFKETDSRSIYRSGLTPLPGDNVEKDTFDKISDRKMTYQPKTVRFTFRSFDRQWIIADRRVLDRPREPLWEAQQPGQVYLVEQHSIHPRAGAGVHFSSLMPDTNAFNNRGGRTLPMLHPSGKFNLAEGLVESLTHSLGTPVEGAYITQYVAAVVSHPQFVEQFTDELHTPGIRVPITAQLEIWDRAVALGKEVLVQQTFGDYGQEDESYYEGLALPRYESAVGENLAEDLIYDSERQELIIGAGRWSNVSPEVANYQVGGVKIVDSWFGYRRKNPRGKTSSPLDQMHPLSWEPEWSIELTEILQVLTKLVALEAIQEVLLEDLVLSSKLSMTDLAAFGFVTYGNKDPKRKPQKGGAATLPIDI